jgi:hypothetical protein
VYLLFNEVQNAYSVREFLKRVLVSCGLRDGTGGVKAGQVEVFPRQDSVAEGKFGNMFVLALADKSLPLTLTDAEDVLW